jgi:hypothetical protein
MSPIVTTYPVRRPQIPLSRELGSGCRRPAARRVASDRSEWRGDAIQPFAFRLDAADDLDEAAADHQDGTPSDSVPNRPGAIDTD